MSVGSNPSAAVDCFPYPADNSKEVLICHEKGGGSESTIIIGPSKSVLIYALHSLQYVLGLAPFWVFVPKLLLFLYYPKIIKFKEKVLFFRSL